MTLEISLRRPFTLPRVFWAGNGESRQDYHWVGHKQNAEQEPVSTGEKNQKPPNEKDKQKYLLLTELTLGDVEDAIKLFDHQLIPAQENWIGKNTFCQIPLKRKRGQPPMIFGRVKTCFPSDGFLDNVEEMELYFPRKDSAPDVIHIYKDEISRKSQMQVQSNFVRVRVLASAEEKAELGESASMLNVNGFHPEFEPGYLDILDITEANQSAYPWMYVIGSRWFGAMPESLHAEMIAKLKEMIGWGKQIVNYHPGFLAKEIPTLNDVLNYQFGFTPQLLVEPRNVEQLSNIIYRMFDNLFHAGVK